jgi:hypothetical protein
METQNGGNAVASKPVRTWIQKILFAGLNVFVGIGLLWLAVLEALLAPFFGMKFALCAIATAACALALFLALLGLGIDLAGSWLISIHEKLTSLHSEELQKLVTSQRRVVPSEPPANGRTH